MGPSLAISRTNAGPKDAFGEDSNQSLHYFKLAGNTRTRSGRTAKGFKAIPYNIPEGCAAAYFPEANVLVPLNSVADKSHTPTSKFIEIEIERMIVK